MPDFDIIGQGINGGAPSGLLMGLDPSYQIQQAALRKANAFQDGLPRDAQGNLDLGAVRDKLLQVGDYGDASSFMATDLQQQSIAAAMRNAGAVGQYGGGHGGSAPAGDSGLLAGLGGAQPTNQQGNTDWPAMAAKLTGLGAPSAPAAPLPQAGAGGQGASGLDPLDVYAHSLGSLESGNRYDALGQVQKNGAQAIGRYQVMSTNVPSWTKDVLGQAMSPEEFRNDPQAQDAVFRAKFGQSLQQYGNPLDAASVWFSGKPLNRVGNATDSLGTTVPSYIQKFAAGLSPAVQALRGGQGGGQPQEQGQAPSSVGQGGQGGLISFGGLAPATPQTAAGSASAGTAEGAPAPSVDERPMTGIHPFAKVPGGSALPTSFNGSTGGGAPAVRAGPVSAGPQGGAQPTGTGGAPQTAPATPTAPALGGMPPDAAAALQRLQNRQGAPADGQLWGAYLKSVGGSIPGGAVAAPPVGQPGTRLVVGQGGAPAAPSSPYGAPPPGARTPPVPTMPTTPPTGLLDPSLGGQVPDAWLKAGFTPGAWVNYARQQAAINGNLPFGAGKANQEAWNAIANGVAQTIDKSMQFTSEQRNARDALAVQYETDKARRDQALRLAADTSPSRIDFAGRQAAATAAGTAAGQNTPDAIAGRAANAAAVGEAQGQGKYLGGLSQQYAQAADAGRAANDNIDQMLQAAQGFRTGAGADVIQGARKGLQTGLGLMGVNSPLLNDSTASYEDLMKLTGAHSRNVASTIAGPKGVQELQLINSSLLSPETSPDGFRAVSASLKGSNDYSIAKQQASQDWAADPAHRNSLSGFEANFNRNVSPSAFWLNRLRVDQPDLFTQSVQRLGQTEQGRTLLGKVKSGMAWASQQGLF